jgi:hypothetical protein
MLEAEALIDLFGVFTHDFIRHLKYVDKDYLLVSNLFLGDECCSSSAS